MFLFINSKWTGFQNCNILNVLRIKFTNDNINYMVSVEILNNANYLSTQFETLVLT